MLDTLNFNRWPSPGGSPGAGTPLLFAHGYGCDQTVWHAVASRLTDRERLLFDWPGAGKASPSTYDPSRHAELNGYAHDLNQLIERQVCTPVICVAHSVAASIALLAAERAPHLFRQLILVAPSPCFLNVDDGYQGGFTTEQLEQMIQGLTVSHATWSRAMAPVIIGNPRRPTLAEQLGDRFCAMDPTIALRWAKATFFADVRQTATRVEVPAVVLQCREDALAPERVGRWLADQLPRGRFVQLSAAGHCPHMSEPEELARVIAQAIN